MGNLPEIKSILSYLILSYCNGVVVSPAINDLLLLRALCYWMDIGESLHIYQC